MPNNSKSAETLDRACRLHDVAVVCREHGKHRHGEAAARKALALFEKTVGPNHPGVANVLNNLAGIYSDTGQYPKAQRLLIRSVQIVSRCDATDPDLVRLHVQSLDNLGTVYRLQGCYREAEPLFKRALRLAEKKPGRDDAQAATALNNLAVLYKYTGQFNQAEKLYRRALRIVEKACRCPLTRPSGTLSHRMGEGWGEGDGPAADVSRQSFLATIYHNLGGLEHSRERYARGEPFARRSVEIREQALGPNHPDVAADVAALAGLLDGQGKYAESEPLYHRALKIFRRVYGPEHYEIAVNYNNLAAVYQAQGKTARAEQLYQRALGIKEKLLGREHPDVAMTLNNLAMFYEAQGRYSRAEPLLQRAIAIFKKALGPKNVKVLICKQNLASLQKAAKAAKR